MDSRVSARANTVSGRGYSPPVTPFGGWTRDGRGRLRPLETAPHIGAFAPPGTGKTRKWLAQAATLWPGPALVSSSKDDLMQLVASRRSGRCALLDLRPVAAPWYPSDFTGYRYDPTALITDLSEAMALAETLLSTGSVSMSGSAFRAGSDPGPWDQLAFAPLTCLLYAASALGRSMEWTLAAAENVAVRGPDDPQPSHAEPSWRNAAMLCGDELFRARVASVLGMEPRQRDSVKITVTKVLTAWLRTSRRDRTLPAITLDFLEDPTATIYLLTPADGTVAAQAIALMDQLINRQRTKVAQWEQFHRVGFFLDEITNTPLPRLPQYLAESRGLGTSICYAAQAGSQLDAIYGPLQGRAIRDVTPASLVMYGSHERDLMESAAFWAGKTTRSEQSYTHNGDDMTTQRHFGNALDAEELMPTNLHEARLIVRGGPGQRVSLLSWESFTGFLDELRSARAGIHPCTSARINPAQRQSR